MRFGDLVARDGEIARDEQREEEAEEEVARAALENAKPCEIKVAPGAHEEVELQVDEPTTLYVSVDVLRGRDVDFGIMHLARSGESDPSPTRLFGPCRRATSLSANVRVDKPGTVILGFDNSGMVRDAQALLTSLITIALSHLSPLSPLSPFSHLCDPPGCGSGSRRSSCASARGWATPNTSAASPTSDPDTWRSVGKRKGECV